MAITYDTTTTSTKVAALYTTHTVAHTVTSATNRALIVMVTNVNGINITGVTFNGVALSTYQARIPSSTWQMETWVLFSPDSGTHNIVVTFASGIVGDMVVASSFSGVKQTGNPSAVTNAQAFATSVSDGLVTSNDDNMFYVGAVSDATPTLGDGETQVAAIDIGSSYITTGYAYAPVAGVITVSATKAGSTEFNLQAIAFQPEPATGSNGSFLLGYLASQ